MNHSYEKYIKEFEELEFKGDLSVYKTYKRWSFRRKIIHFSSSALIVFFLLMSNSNIGTTSGYNVVDDNIYKVELESSDKFQRIQVILGEGLSFVSEKFPSVSELRELDFDISSNGLSILVTSDSVGSKPIILKYYNKEQKYLIKKLYLNISSL